MRHDCTQCQREYKLATVAAKAVIVLKFAWWIWIVYFVMGLHHSAWWLLLFLIGPSWKAKIICDNHGHPLGPEKETEALGSVSVR